MPLSLPKSLGALLIAFTPMRVNAQVDRTQCGANQVSGYQTCGLGTCCSVGGYCGFTSPYCSSGCQSSYGHCGLLTEKTCSSTSGAVSARTVGYYATGAQDRPCDVVNPNQINTKGYTHINFAFLCVTTKAKLSITDVLRSDIDSTNCVVAPDPNAPYNDFTALKSSSVQAWISVGGAGDGSYDVVGPSGAFEEIR